MPFYPFHQNNSGGIIIGPARYVYIEAPSASIANRLAGEYDIYFNGASYQRDCECCGDRWYECSESDALENPHDDWVFHPDNLSYDRRDKVPFGMIYYADGRKEKIAYPNVA